MGWGARVFAIAAACVLLSAATTWADGYGDFNNGVASADREEFAAAVTSLTAAISAPDLPAHLLPVAHLARGYAYNAQGQNNAAIADFTAAIALKKDYLDAYLERCETNKVLGNFKQALADCTAAIQIQPDNWQLYNARIPIDWELGKFDDAIADYTRFVALRPGDTELLIGRSEAFRRAGKLGQALMDANAAQDTAPKLVSPQVELGQVYLSQGDLTNALASFETATKLAPKNATVFELKGQVEWAMGRFGDAVDSFKDSLEQNEFQEDAFVWLSMSRGRKGDKLDTRMAERFAKADLSAWPGPMVQLYLGKSTPEDALKAADLYHVRCNADFLVGEWYATQGNSSAAKTTLQQTARSCRTGSLFEKFATIDLGRLP